MSVARRLRLPFFRSGFSDAAQSLESRVHSLLPQTEARQYDNSPSKADRAEIFSDFISRAVHIARIDLDRDPWWLYFRRRQ